MKTREMLTRTRMCSIEALQYNIPFCCAMSRKAYEEYFDSEIMLALPYDYVGIVEEHQDWYYHAVKSREQGERIISEGILRVDKSNDNCSCGKGVYTFPCNCGRVATAIGDYVIKFKSKQEHVHIVNYADTTNKPLGECIFFEDVELEEVELLSIYDAGDASVKAYYSCNDVMKHYYGIDIERPSLEELPEVLMDVVVNKPSDWYDYEKRVTNFTIENYRELYQRFTKCEVAHVSGHANYFTRTDLHLLRCLILRELKDNKDNEDTKTMNLF